MITVFTPTYNRAYTLAALYQSLCKQSFKNFEWLIVDDGSIDNTSEVVKSFISDKQINIRYHYQRNGGKHTAINCALTFAKGEYFFIVDSDDYLVDNALDVINKHLLSIKNKTNYCGVSGNRVYSNGKIIGKAIPSNILDCSILDLRYKYNITGDKAEVFYTNILRQYPFPEIVGERFCSEALVAFKVSNRILIRNFNEPITICEYLEDGLTASNIKIRRNSPILSQIYYLDLLNYNIPFLDKYLAMVNYWRFGLCKRRSSIFKDMVKLGIAKSFISIMPGCFFYCIDKYRETSTKLNK